MRLPVLVLAPVIAACAAGDGTDDDPRDPLASPQRATVAAGESKTTVHASIRRPDGVHAGDAELLVTSGQVVVHVEREADGHDQLVLDELRVAYRDVVLPPAYFHDGQVLTGIAVRLDEPVVMDARMTETGTLWGNATTDLRLDWDLRVDGEPYGLAPQTLEDFALELFVSAQGGTLRADLTLARDGVVWTWADDVITLADATLITSAYGSID